MPTSAKSSPGTAGPGSGGASAPAGATTKPVWSTTAANVQALSAVDASTTSQAANASVRVFSEVSTANGTAAQMASAAQSISPDGGTQDPGPGPASRLPGPRVGPWQGIPAQAIVPRQPQNREQTDRGKTLHQDRLQFSRAQTAIS
jgi:hypothetical protein